MKKIFFGILCSMAFILSASAQSVTGSSYVSTAVPFLNITPDSRAAGMGDVGVATSADINSIHWNVAKAAFLENKGGFSLSYTPWLKDIASGMSVGYVSGYYKLGEKHTISGSFKYFNLGEVDITNGTGQNLKTSSPNEFAIDLGYSRILGQYISMGVAFRYIRSNIMDSEVGNSIAADVSCFYTKPVNNGNLAFGVNISNIGSKMDYGSNSYYLPTNLRLGTTYTRQLSPDSKLSGSFDVNKLLVDNDDSVHADTKPGIVVIGNQSNEDVFASMISSLSDFSSITYSFGAEYLYKDKFAARLGYFYEDEEAGNRSYFTTGLGVNYSKIDFDMAYLVTTDSNNPMKNTLRFTVGYIF